MRKLLLSLASFLFVAGSVFAQGAGSLPSGGTGGGGGITPPAGDIGGTAVAPTVVGLEAIALPTLAGNTGCLLDTSGVLSLTSGACAPLLSPTFTGTPAGPTAAAGTNTTQLATTAFVNTIFAAPPSLGSTTPANVSASTLSASGVVSGAGFSTYLASPPAIGGTAAAAGSFTSLSSSGALTNTLAGTASAPGVTFSGAPFTGGSGTTTFPQTYLNAGAAPTTFATTGTMLGINSPAAIGNLIDAHVNGGGSVFAVASSGTTTLGGKIQATAVSNSANTNHLWYSGTAPTIAAAGCGGSAASIASNNGAGAFTINVGTAPTSGGCAITLPAATTGWNCYVTDITTNSTSVFLQKQTVTSTTGATLVNFSDVAAATAPTASDIWAVSCFAY